jgi:two-component system, NarL family, sensor histidine kinase DegS
MASDEATAPSLADEVRAEIAGLDRELEEISMLVGQARTEANRHENRRATATDKITNPGPNPNLVELAELYGTLVALTRRAVLMQAQVDVLEGKQKALQRHRDAIALLADRLEGVVVPDPAALAAAAGEGVAPEDEPLPPGLSRVVLSAQEDLRREIARAMHDGPAQSLTNIVLQAQIVDRLLDRDPAMARGELRLLVGMVQATLDATKNFIFDVRPMVLDDLGLVPTLRRATRDRGRRAHVPVEFESLGADRRLPVDIESAVFRILDEALAGYLATNPEVVSVRVDWGEELDCRILAVRTPAEVVGDPLPEIPAGDIPDTIRRMIQDRHEARAAAVAAAEQAAIVVLPAHARRDVLERAGSIGARVEILSGGGELHLVVPLPLEGYVEGGAPA